MIQYPTEWQFSSPRSSSRVLTDENCWPSSRRACKPLPAPRVSLQTVPAPPAILANGCRFVLQALQTVMLTDICLHLSTRRSVNIRVFITKPMCFNQTFIFRAGGMLTDGDRYLSTLRFARLARQSDNCLQGLPAGRARLAS